MAMSVSFSVKDASKPSSYDASSNYETNSVVITLSGIPSGTDSVKWQYTYGTNTYSYTNKNIQNLADKTKITIPMSIMSKFVTNTSTVTLNFSATSMKGSSITQNVSSSVKITMPTWVVPVITSSSTSIVSAGANTSFGYVQNKSKCSISYTAKGSCGCEIKSVNVKCATTGYNNTVTANSATYSGSMTSTTLTKFGNLAFVITVTDARGRTATTTKTITVNQYANPSITSLKAERYNAKGVKDSNGTYAKAISTFSCSSLGGKNTCSATLSFKASGQTTYTTVGNVSNNTLSSLFGNGLFDINKTHSICLTVTDTVGCKSTKYFDILGISYIIDVLNGGTGLGLGCEATTSGQLDIGYKTVFKRPVTMGEVTHNTSVGMKNNCYIEFTNPSGVKTFQVGLSGANNAHLFSQDNYTGNLTIGHASNNSTIINGKGGTNITLTNDGKNQVYSKAIYDRTYSSGATVTVTDYGTLGRISSASKYKLGIDKIQEDENYAYNILKLEPKQWFDKTSCEKYSEYLSGKLKIEPEPGCGIDSIYGLIAEDVEKAGLGKYCLYNEKGELEGVQYERLWTLLLPVVRKQQETIDEQQDKISELEERLNKLEKLLINEDLK